jgi:hypothetical protein
LANYGCWSEYTDKDFSAKTGDLRLKCKSCKITLVISPVDSGYNANLIGH